MTIRRNDGDGIGFPAGIVKWGETPFQTAIRETKEETGLETEIVKLIGIYNHRPKTTLELNSIYIVFSGKVLGGKLRESVEGKSEWLIKKEILRFQPSLAEIIYDYEKRKS